MVTLATRHIVKVREEPVNIDPLLLLPRLVTVAQNTPEILSSFSGMSCPMFHSDCLTRRGSHERQESHLLQTIFGHFLQMTSRTLTCPMKL